MNKNKERHFCMIEEASGSTFTLKVNGKFNELFESGCSVLDVVYSTSTWGDWKDGFNTTYYAFITFFVEDSP